MEFFTSRYRFKASNTKCFVLFSKKPLSLRQWTSHQLTTINLKKVRTQEDANLPLKHHWQRVIVGIRRELRTLWMVQHMKQATDLDNSSNTEIINFLKTFSAKTSGPSHMNLDRPERLESYRLSMVLKLEMQTPDRGYFLNLSKNLLWVFYVHNYFLEVSSLIFRTLGQKKRTYFSFKFSNLEIFSCLNKKNFLSNFLVQTAYQLWCSIARYGPSEVSHILNNCYSLVSHES